MLYMQTRASAVCRIHQVYRTVYFCSHFQWHTRWSACKRTIMAAASDTSFPCGFCKVSVKDGDIAMQCKGSCSLWFHCSCIFHRKTITNAQYKKLVNSSNAWYFANCTGDCTLDFPLFNSVNAIEVFHFDFQKNLPTPKLTVLRLLWTYNFGVYCASEDVLCAFVWNELVGLRGANNVVSCLFKLVWNTKFGHTVYMVGWQLPRANHRVIWCLQDLIRQHVYSRVDYKFNSHCTTSWSLLWRHRKAC